jgi:hypothetical protein
VIDGFSRYNQVPIHDVDKEKTAFTTPWGTFMYDKMPFGLMNARDNFETYMDITFIGDKDEFIAIYLDDITVFSQYDIQHLSHLR